MDALINIEAEEAVIASCLCNPEVITDVANKITYEEAFTRDDLRVLWKCIKYHEERQIPCDLVTANRWLQDKGLIARVGGVPGLKKIFSMLDYADWAAVAHHADQVLEAFQRRCGHTIATRIQKTCESVTSDFQDDMAAHLSSLDSVYTSATKSDQVETADSLMQRLVEDHKVRRERILTGMPRLDDMTGGLGMGQYTVIGARPSVGKTAMGLNICLNAAMQGVPTLFVSLEMTLADVRDRIVCHVTDTNMLALNQMGAEELQALCDQTCDTLSDAPLHAVGVEYRRLHDLIPLCKQMVRRKGVRLICIDYLQRVISKGRSSVEELGCISNSVAALCKEKDSECSLIMLAQLNRESEKENRAPGSYDIKGSGDVEQDADCMLLLSRVDSDAQVRSPSREYTDVLVQVAKNRNGGTGDIPMRFHKTTMTFHPHRMEIADGS